MQENSPWLIYALGGGWGHLNRAVALGRVLARSRPMTILTNSAYADRVSSWLLSKSDHEPVPQLSVIPADADAAIVREKVAGIVLNSADATTAGTTDAMPYDGLIVDTFPRGLAGELADLLPQLHQVFRVLVHRDLHPDYVRAKNLVTFVQHHYHSIVIPGEGTDLAFAHLPQVTHTSPWLVCNANELPDAAAVRMRLNLAANSEDSSSGDLSSGDSSSGDSSLAPVILVCAAGQLQELAFFGEFTAQVMRAYPQAIVRCIAASCPPGCPASLWLPYYPALEIFSIADVVISAAGYNITYECAALGIPLVSFAFPRLYDRQARRAQRQNYWVTNSVDAMAQIQVLLNQRTLQRSLQRKSLISQQTSMYLNGVMSAADQIHQHYFRFRQTRSIQEVQTERMAL